LDPLFGGISGYCVAGAVTENEFFSFDGGDAFTKALANAAWIDGLLPNNSQFSYICALYPDTASNCVLFGTSATSTRMTACSSTCRASCSSSSTPPSAALDTVGGAADALSLNDWHIVGESLNEGGGAVSFFYADGNYLQVGASNTLNAAYATPQAGKRRLNAAAGRGR
jgi:hypothetical protein